MSLQRGASPFDRLRRTLEDGEIRCRACGYVDSEGNWRVRAVGSRVRYQFTCRTCGAVDTREIRL